MAVLPDNDRASLWAEIIREFAARGITDTALTKPQGRTIVDALDEFLSDNAAAINQSIPATERALATVAEKAIIFRAVVAFRYLKGV